jgi:hypothetical protein
MPCRKRLTGSALMASATILISLVPLWATSDSAMAISQRPLLMKNIRKVFAGAPVSPASREKALAALGYVMMRRRLLRATQTSHILSNHEYQPDPQMAVQIGETVLSADETDDGVMLDGTSLSVATDWLPGDLFAEAEVDGQFMKVSVDAFAGRAMA